MRWLSKGRFASFSIVRRMACEGHGGKTWKLEHFSLLEERMMNRKVNRKIDLFILPFLSLMYLFSGLDRGKSLVVCSLIEGNVGNAQTNGFTSDVGIPADALNNAVSLFFVTFVVFQPISAGIGKRVGPKYW